MKTFLHTYSEEYRRLLEQAVRESVAALDLDEGSVLQRLEGEVTSFFGVFRRPHTTNQSPAQLFVEIVGQAVMGWLGYHNWLSLTPAGVDARETVRGIVTKLAEELPAPPDVGEVENFATLVALMAPTIWGPHRASNLVLRESGCYLEPTVGTEFDPLRDGGIVWETLPVAVDILEGGLKGGLLEEVPSVFPSERRFRLAQPVLFQSQVAALIQEAREELRKRGGSISRAKKLLAEASDLLAAT